MRWVVCGFGGFVQDGGKGSLFQFRFRGEGWLACLGIRGGKEALFGSVVFSMRSDGVWVLGGKVKVF